ncbi:uncharacterized protein LOC110707185 [Chenopodium quinoa]|uniref:uncharacterized protein LOC110707185 n=1 Tax=Chenopodium quinoa TaxID=63459 RepID=UPI000B7756A4|nr:uncharacterized protein LOC110707185 [Chenopodium quinoa]
MGDVVVLQFQYRGIDVAVNVDDIDKVNLIDLIVECFANLPDEKEIYVWVVDGLKDTQVVAAARSLILGSASARGPKLIPRRRQNTFIEAEVISEEEFQRRVASLKTPETTPQVEAYIPEGTNIEDTWADILSDEPQTLESLVEVRILNHLSLLGHQPYLGENFLGLLQRSRKGIVISVSASGGDSDLNTVSAVRSRKRSSLVSLGDDSNGYDNQSLSLYEDEDDGGYEPNESDNGDDTDESVDTEDDLSRDEYGPMIEDAFDLYDEPVFECEKDEDYCFCKLYNNGEVYQEMGFGRIVSKPWQLFINKQHLRDVVRDYCIQCGFVIIVYYASNSRYIVRCSDAHCGWRLHVVVLPDGTTWAIKLIQNSEHTCQGLETRNNMVNVRWVKSVLMDDIRANNDIC